MNPWQSLGKAIVVAGILLALAAGYPVTLARLPGVDHLSMSSGSPQETVGDIVDLGHR